MMKNRCVCLLTDFGIDDTYVAEMKAIMLRINRQLNFVDLTHNIAQADVQKAAFVLSCAYRFFPVKTIFLIVVDPGVATQRKALAVKIKDYYFICPDNGILSYVIEREKNFTAFNINNPRYFNPQLSKTFHGRDLFSPVAAYLSKGIPLYKFGSKIKRIVRLELIQVKIKGSKIIGQIVYNDHFGNLITNISFDVFKKVNPDQKKYQVLISNKKIPILDAYAQVKPNQLLAIFGSRGYLEIAVNCRSAYKRLKIKRKMKCTLQKV